MYASREHSPDFVVNAAGDVYRVISDQLGSPRLIVNVANSTDILLEAEYSAFGERTVVGGSAPDALTLGFAGGIYDWDTGLTRFGARDYDATVGRWTARDPIRFVGGANMYSYVGCDPLNLTDPTGLIIVAGDSAGQQLLYGLAETPAGHQLLNYLQSSPIEYAVFGSGLRPDDPAGQFGLLEREGAECAPMGDQMVRVNSSLGLSEEQLIVTLGHELGHAALYDDFFLSRPGLPDFIDRAAGDPLDPGGISGAAHFLWGLRSSELFSP